MSRWDEKWTPLDRDEQLMKRDDVRAGLNAKACGTPASASQDFGQGQNELNQKVARLVPQLFPCCRCGYRTGKAAMLIRYKAPFCSEECVERAGDFALDDGQEMIAIKNFPGDLNACAKFEKGLPANLREKYLDWLADATETPESDADAEDEEWRLTTATAEERCRAFVATMEGRSDRERNENHLAFPGSPKFPKSEEGANK